MVPEADVSHPDDVGIFEITLAPDDEQHALGAFGPPSPSRERPATSCSSSTPICLTTGAIEAATRAIDQGALRTSARADRLLVPAVDVEELSGRSRVVEQSHQDRRDVVAGDAIAAERRRLDPDVTGSWVVVRPPGLTIVQSRSLAWTAASASAFARR